MKNTARNNGNACPIGTVTQKIAYNMVFGGLFSQLIQPLSSLPFFAIMIFVLFIFKTGA